MHVAGLQSALAIRRQRKRREEQKKARERRFSTHSTESGLTSPRGSQASLDRAGHGRLRNSRRTTHPDILDTKVTSIGMLHIGVVFLVLGFFLIGSGLLPDQVTSWSSLGTVGWWNELVCTGIFAMGVGLFLIILNKYISKKEDQDLEKYVQSQLTRSRSGHRLERDVETGGMITKHTKREKKQQKEDEERNLSGCDYESPPKTPRSPNELAAPVHHGFLNPVAINGDANREHHLDQIIEEDYSASEKGEEDNRKMDYFNKETYSNYSSATITSPVTPSDTRELIINEMQIIMSRM